MNSNPQNNFGFKYNSFANEEEPTPAQSTPNMHTGGYPILTTTVPYFHQPQVQPKLAQQPQIYQPVYGRGFANQGELQAKKQMDKWASIVKVVSYILLVYSGINAAITLLTLTGTLFVDESTYEFEYVGENGQDKKVTVDVGTLCLDLMIQVIMYTLVMMQSLGGIRAAQKKTSVQTKAMVSQALACIILFFVLAIIKGCLDIDFVMSLTDDSGSQNLRGTRNLQCGKQRQDGTMHHKQHTHGNPQEHSGYASTTTQSTSNDNYYGDAEMTDADVFAMTIALCIVLTGGVCLGIFGCYMKFHKAVKRYECISSPQVGETQYSALRGDMEPRVEHNDQQAPRFAVAPVNGRQQYIFSPVMQRPAQYQTAPYQVVYPQFVPQQPIMMPQYMPQRAPVQQWTQEPRETTEPKIDEVKEEEERVEQPAASNFPFIQMGYQPQAEQMRSAQAMGQPGSRQVYPQFAQPTGYYYVRK